MRRTRSDDFQPLSQPFLVRVNEVHEVFEVVAMAESALLFPHLEPRDVFSVIGTRSSASQFSLPDQELRLESARLDH